MLAYLFQFILNDVDLAGMVLVLLTIILGIGLTFHHGRRREARKRSISNERHSRDSGTYATTESMTDHDHPSSHATTPDQNRGRGFGQPPPNAEGSALVSTQPTESANDIHDMQDLEPQVPAQVPDIAYEEPSDPASHRSQRTTTRSPVYGPRQDTYHPQRMDHEMTENTVTSGTLSDDQNEYPNPVRSERKRGKQSHRTEEGPPTVATGAGRRATPADRSKEPVNNIPVRTDQTSHQSSHQSSGPHVVQHLAAMSKLLRTRETHSSATPVAGQYATRSNSGQSEDAYCHITTSILPLATSSMPTAARARRSTVATMPAVATATAYSSPYAAAATSTISSYPAATGASHHTTSSLRDEPTETAGAPFPSYGMFPAVYGSGDSSNSRPPPSHSAKETGRKSSKGRGAVAQVMWYCVSISLRNQMVKYLPQ